MDEINAIKGLAMGLQNWSSGRQGNQEIDYQKVILVKIKNDYFNPNYALELRHEGQNCNKTPDFEAVLRRNSPSSLLRMRMHNSGLR